MMPNLGVIFQACSIPKGLMGTLRPPFIQKNTKT